MPPTISCPRCGHHFNGSQEAARLVDQYTTDSPTFSVDQEDDVTVALEELRRLDDLIHQLNQDKARLFRHVNNVQAATRHLPPEVLSTIFQFACPPIDFDTRSRRSELSKSHLSGRDMYKEDDFQLALGAVSYQWRKAAWATPQLWTTTSVKIYVAGGENSVSLLNLYFENSRGHPMTVELECRVRLLDPYNSGVPEKSILLIESIATLFLNNAAKIQNFIVTGLPVEWTSRICKNLLRCESMTLCWSSSSSYMGQWRNDLGSRLDLTQLPNLHHFHVEEPYFPFALPWSVITTLQLSGVPVSQGVESLAKCPNIIKFDSKGLRPDNSSPSLNQRVTLEHLELLTWCAYDGTGSSTLMRHMRFSRLRILNWSIRPYNGTFPEEFYNELATFFLSLPATLQVLELSHIRYEDRMMKAILPSVPHLAELILKAEKSLYFPYSIAMDMIGRPVIGLAEGTVKGAGVVYPNHLGGPKVLPRLRKLTLSGGPSSLTPVDVVSIVEMLEALHGARVMQEHFSLEMIGAPMDDARSPEVLARLKQLAESGFEFETLLGSRRLDYMSSPVDVIC